jgi:rhamnulokinase
MGNGIKYCCYLLNHLFLGPGKETMNSLDTLRLLAFDLGAESGRAMIGHFDGQLLELEEIHRFSNTPVRLDRGLYWDVLRLWSDIQQGLAKAADLYGGSLVSIGLDTWGVDFGLLASDDSLLGNPYHYRDRRTNGMLELAFSKVPREEIYQKTGIQFMQLNSLYQLLAMASTNSPVLAAAETFLNMPDLFNFWLTGRKASEFTIATTSQCYDPISGDWAYNLIESLDIPTKIFRPIIQPGTVIDRVRPSLSDEIGCGQIAVVAPACHDTGSAVAAVPAEIREYIYLSSGTWSLMGVEVDKPVITAESLKYNFTNEGGVNGTFRLLKNIMGMWLLQECRRVWGRRGRLYSYDELTSMAEAAPAFGPLVYPGDNRFLAPGDMPTLIQSYCKESGQEVPQSEGAIVRTILESLALEYRWVAERLDKITGKRRDTIHIIGGGSRNRLLNQFTADATMRKVVAGPVEATAAGNLLIQALALGHLASIEECRAVVRRSFDVETYEPGNSQPWDAAYERYVNMR